MVNQTSAVVSLAWHWMLAWHDAFLCAAVVSMAASTLLTLILRAARPQRTAPVPTEVAAVLDALPSMIGYWDAALQNRFANRSYARWFKIDPQSGRGTRLREFHGEELYQSVR